MKIAVMSCIHGNYEALDAVLIDYQKTCQVIIDQGLPPIFAWRLARGWEFAEKADDPTHICQR